MDGNRVMRSQRRVGAPRTGPSLWQRLRWPVLVVSGVWLAAGGVRYGLIEPQAWSEVCEAARWQSVACVLRTATIESFVAQRVGWVALSLAVLATVTRWRPVAVGALAAGTAALVLYTADLGAPAVLLALLVLARHDEPAGDVR